MIEINKGFFRLARNVSRLSECEIRVGAVLCNKKPVSIGFNVEKTHPQFNSESMNTATIHAEGRAILLAFPIHCHNAVMYVYRETAAGIPALAKPCKMCYNSMRRVGIKKVYYTIGEYPYWRCERL